MTRTEAIEWAGSVEKLADKLNITTQAIYYWGDNIPRGRQFELFVISGGALQVTNPKSKAA